MKRFGQLVLAAIAIAAFFALGSFFLEQGSSYLQANELSYNRKGQPPIVVSTEVHAFSFYYQVAFWLSMGFFLVLLAVSICLFFVAKFIRSTERSESKNATGTLIYRAATVIGYGSVASIGVWVLLRMFRSVLIQ